MNDAAGADTIFIFIFGHGKDGIVRGTKDDVTCFRNYPDAALEHATGGVQAGRARDDVAAIEALPGFEDVAALGGRLTLASVLGVAFDEASARWTRAQPRAGGAAARWDPSRRSWRGRARNWRSCDGGSVWRAAADSATRRTYGAVQGR